MSGPRYRIMPHVHAAFGGVFGTINLLVGAVSISRQIARMFAVGLSPVLKSIFAAYVQIFHGLVDFSTAALSLLLGFDLTVPPWMHDWIILWFVGTGAMFRLVTASVRARWQSVHTEGLGSHINPLFGWLDSLADPSDDTLPIVRLTRLCGAYLLLLVIWPALLLILWSDPTVRIHATPNNRLYKLSLRSLFLLQALAIAITIFGLSVLNAQTQ